jgi:hypothetical protein
VCMYACSMCLYVSTYTHAYIHTYTHTHTSLIRAQRDDEGHTYDEEAAMGGNGHTATENGGSDNNTGQEEHAQQSEGAACEQENVTAAV